MIRENDLLPWIMGGLSLATIAVAVTVSSTVGTAPKKLPTPVQAAAFAPTPTPAPAAAPVSASAPALASAPEPVPVPATAPPPDPSLALDPVQPAGAPMTSANQIWECTTNGQRTFSDKPCGGHATLREMNPLNVMNVAPRSPPTFPYPPDSSNAPDYYYPDGPDGQDAVSSSYPVVVGYPYVVRRRPEHLQRPYHPQSVPVPRGVSAPRRN
jgi:hypothetical protein